MNMNLRVDLLSSDNGVTAPTPENLDIVRIWLSAVSYIDVETFSRDGVAGVKVRADARLVVIPEAANCVTVEVRR